MRAGIDISGEGQPYPAASGSEPSWARLFRELCETLLLALVLFVAVRSTLQNTRVDGHSMEPTLHDGQHVMVNKLFYQLGDPARGDIVVLRSPQGGPLPLIKRVIALPGEKVAVVGGQVLIDGVPLIEPYLPADHGAANWGPYALGPGEYMVMGDNRDSSNDSRRFGPVQRPDIIGRAWFSLWPLTRGIELSHSSILGTAAQHTTPAP